MTQRHVLSLSGGKDSAALAIYLRDRVADMEYIFNDTGKELPETYEYLERIEDYIGRPIKRLNAERSFDHWYVIYGRMIPSNQRRWCTKMLKLKPFEEFVGSDAVLNYIGIRADENRGGYLSRKPNITPVYPFVEDGIGITDVHRILRDAGIGLPPYTAWGRTRSGCYFCFYQQKSEWVNLLEHHPELFEKAEEYEREFEKSGNLFTWSKGEKLSELRQPQRVAEIRKDAQKKSSRTHTSGNRMSLYEIFRSESERSDVEERSCLICSL